MKVRIWMMGYLTIAMIALATLACCYVGYRTTKISAGKFDAAATDSFADIRALGELKGSVRRVAINNLDLIARLNRKVHPRVSDEAQEQKLIVDGNNSMDEALRSFKNHVAAVNEDKVTAGKGMEALEEDCAFFLRNSAELRNLTGKKASGAVVLAQRNLLLRDEDRLLSAVDSALQKEDDAFKVRKNEVAQAMADAWNWQIVFFVAFFTLVFISGAVTIAQYRRQLIKLRRYVENIGAGTPSEGKGALKEIDGEFGTISTIFDEMTTELQSSRNESVTSRNKLSDVFNSINDSVIIVGWYN